MSQTLSSIGVGGAVADGISRRRFVGYILAGSTLAVTAGYALPEEARAAEGAAPIPSNDLFADEYDFMDLMRDGTRPTAAFWVLEVTPEGRVRFEMPRAEMGQGLTTAFAMIIADQMEIPYEQVDVDISPARVELWDGQLTGGSASVYALWEPLRAMSELARQRLAATAAKAWNVSPRQVRTQDGYVYGPDGQRRSYGSLAVAAALPDDQLVEFTVGPPKGGIIGKSVVRKDMHAIITGTKQFAMDLDIPNAMPTMICRPPQLNGTVESVQNLDQVKKMPGVTDVAVIPAAGKSEGVAVRATTFGQCIDAIRALRVRWGMGSTGPVESDSLLEQVAAVQLPMRPATPGEEVLEHVITFQYRSGSPLETNCAVADVRADSAEIWAACKVPNIAMARAADLLGLPLEKMTLHNVMGGGSFGRKLHADHVLEAAAASQAFGKPVRLMWHRTDDVRHGRMHPASVSHVRATKVGNSITSFTQRHASSACDFTHGPGDVITGRMMSADPSKTAGNFSVTAGFFQMVTQVPYNFGPTNVALNEAFEYDFLPTSAVRNVYSPDVAVARELLVENLAQSFGMDGYEFRRAFLKKPEAIAVLDAVAKAGQWGRKMEPGTAQAIAFHEEYKCSLACLMEIDNRPNTVNRKTPQGKPAGPRITKAVFGVDIGLPINPDGIKAQAMGGVIDGIACAMAESSHIVDGLPLQGSWDDYGYTRQWNTPFEFECIVMPARHDVPGGAGEIGNAAAYAATALALQAVTGKKFTEFPINYRDKPNFTPIPKVPPIPQSPISGRRFAR
jgi:isoquinoline 1-oxidoreductase beta subunit